VFSQNKTSILDIYLEGILACFFKTFEDKIIIIKRLSTQN